MKKIIKNDKPYKASIKILGKTYNSSGKTIREAVANLKPEGKCMGISVLSICKGDVQKDKIISSMQVYRLFSPSKMMREVALKGVSLMFDL